MPRRSLAVLALTVLGALASAGSAGAGTYTVHACRTPDGSPAPADGWTAAVVGAGMSAANRCPSGALAAAADTTIAHPRASTLGLTFTAPANTRVSSWDVRRTVHVTAGADWAWNYSAFIDAADFTTDDRRETCWSSDGCREQSATQPWTGTEPASAIVMLIDCSSGHPGDCQPGGVADMVVASAAVSLEDRFDPVYTAPPAGSALDRSHALSGVVGASFSATDAGGGVARAVIEVDGAAVVDEVVGGPSCHPPYIAVVPCSLSAGGALGWDTRGVANGAHRISVLVYDATGTNHASAGPFPVRVSNRGDSACRSAAPKVTAGWRGHARKTVSFGRRSLVRGRVLQPGGAPAAGARVSLIDAGSGGRLASARTGAKGRYTVRAPGSRSRRLRAAVQTAGGALACSRRLRLRVRAGLTLSVHPHAVRNGGRVRLSGRVRSGPIPRTGKLVELQAFDGGRWRTFASLRSDKRGRFATRYRFQRTFSARTFRLRARARAESGYPFVLGVSRSVRVSVRP